MYKFSLSVRAYGTARMYCGLPAYDVWGSIESDKMKEYLFQAGIWVLKNHKGLKTAIELLRAAGAGIWDIYKTLEAKSTVKPCLSYIRELCNVYDRRLHESLD